MNKNLLISKLALAGKKQGCLSELLGLNKATISRKVNGSIPFSVVEISKIKAEFKLSDKEVTDIFLS